MTRPDPGSHPHRIANVRQRRGLEVIALFKLAKGTLSLLVALGAFGLLNAGWANAAESWMEQLAMRETQNFLSHLAVKGLALLDAGPHRLIALGVAALLYSALFFVEGVALWKERRWAEYLTIVSTSLPLPLEIRAVVHHASPIALGVLGFNLMVIAYLVWQLAVTREQHGSPAASSPG